MPRLCAIDCESGEFVIDQEGTLELPLGFWLAEQLNWGSEWRDLPDDAHVHGMALVGKHAFKTFCSWKMPCFFQANSEENDNGKYLNAEETEQCLRKLK